MRALLALLFLFGAGPASAHVTSDAFAPGATWTYDPWLITPLYVSGIAFFIGTRKLWRTAGIGRGVKQSQAIAFWSGWTVLALALVTPLHWLGERLFSAHMVEHELLMIVAAPLIAFARPSGAMAWSLPRSVRPALGAFWSAGPTLAIWSVFGHPVTATLLHGVTLWIWHAPILYNLALASETVHRIEHLSFFFTGLLFWWTLFHGRGPGRGERTRDVIAIGCLFITILHSGLLGALLTLSPHVLYPAQVQFSADFGLAPLEDQQLAGVLMWVPMGTLYTVMALYFAYRLLNSQPSEPAPRAVRGLPANTAWRPGRARL
jgi:cytochrome c oxidase assembly factor CtaG